MENNKSIEEQARIVRLEYYRAWRAKNKDKVKASNARYWERRARRLQAEREGTDAAK